jgi:hypothetical protein
MRISAGTQDQEEPGFACTFLIRGGVLRLNERTNAHIMEPTGSEWRGVLWRKKRL